METRKKELENELLHERFFEHYERGIDIRIYPDGKIKKKNYYFREESMTFIYKWEEVELEKLPEEHQKVTIKVRKKFKKSFSSLQEYLNLMFDSESSNYEVSDVSSAGDDNSLQTR